MSRLFSNRWIPITRRILVPLFLLIGLLITMSCASTSRVAGDQQKNIYLTDNNYIILPPPEILDIPNTLEQSIEGYYGDDSYIMYAITNRMDNSISQVGLSNMGTEIYSYTLSPEGFTYSSPVIDFSGNPMYLLADFYLVYLPFGELEKIISRAGLEVEHHPHSKGWERIILDGGDEIIRITRSGSSILYTNLLRDYGLNIEEIQ